METGVVWYFVGIWIAPFGEPLNKDWGLCWGLPIHGNSPIATNFGAEPYSLDLKS